jgi:hypothetical protein
MNQLLHLLFNIFCSLQCSTTSSATFASFAALVFASASEKATTNEAQLCSRTLVDSMALLASCNSQEQYA